MAFNESCSYKRARGWVQPTRSWSKSAYSRKREAEIAVLQRMYEYANRRGERAAAIRRADANDELRQLFDGLAKQWRDDTSHLSSIPKIVMHPAYQKIVGMGRAALPYILRTMRDQPGYWFWALETIARETPVSPEIAGQTKLMKQAWLEWGEQRGLI